MEEQVEEKEIKVFKEIVEWCFCIFLALIIALATRYYIFTSTVVKQFSMYPTLKENQRIVLSRTKRITKSEYKRGDIVTFEEPSEIKRGAEVDLSNKIAIYNYKPKGIWEKLSYNILELTKKSYIKRVIGLPGDHVEIRNGKVYINGYELDESYLSSDTKTDMSLGGECDNVVVPSGYIYVLGDNRSKSADSRRFGCIPIKKIQGKVVLRWWPVNKIKII